MGNETERFLQFPLYLLRELFIDKNEAINKIIKYGIYRYSTKFHYQKNEVAKQLIYDNYRGELSTVLKKQIKALKSEIIGVDECNVFDSKGEYDPFVESHELLEAFEQNEQLYKNAIEHYQMHMAYKSLRLTGNIEHSLKSAQEIEKQIPINDPMPMVNVKMLFNFRDAEKIEFDIAQFSAYIAIKSILGTKKFVKTNKMHIVSRMFGYSSVKHLPKATAELFKKYSKRWQIDKVIQHLELNWNVLTYSNNIRGMYVSIENKISLDELAMVSETKKLKNRITELKTSKKLAKEKALQQLNKWQQLKEEKNENKKTLTS